MAEYQFYRHSGKVPPTGRVLVLLLGLALTATLGIAYAVTLAWILAWESGLGMGVPFLTGAFGALCGYAVARVSRLGKIRNPGETILLIVLTALFGFVVSWVAWLHALHADLATLSAQGTWYIENGQPTGIWIWILWIIEPFCFVLAAFAGGLTAAESGVFCEKCDCWCRVNAIVLTDEGEPIQALLRGEPARLTRADPRTRHRFVINVFRCPRCPETAALTITRHWQEGETKQPLKQSQNVVDRVLVGPSQIGTLDGL